jgi:hypothetical protein
MVVSLWSIATGISLQDFNNRIDKAAGKLRDLLFGKPEVEQFLYPAANNVDFRSINLLSKAGMACDLSALFLFFILLS